MKSCRESDEELTESESRLWALAEIVGEKFYYSDLIYSALFRTASLRCCRDPQIVTQTFNESTYTDEEGNVRQAWGNSVTVTREKCLKCDWYEIKGEVNE